MTSFCIARRKMSTDGTRVLRTLSSSERIWEMVPCSVLGSGCFLGIEDGREGDGTSEPPMMAMVEFSRMEYDEIGAESSFMTAPA